MLSEEEKTTLEFIKINNKHKYCDKNDVDFLLNLIQKQSKEIEELKNADFATVYLNGIYDGEKKVKDKIKAKIEEIKQRRKDDGECELALHGFQREAKIEVLQSLLEKE